MGDDTYALAKSTYLVGIFRLQRRSCRPFLEFELAVRMSRVDSVVSMRRNVIVVDSDAISCDRFCPAPFHRVEVAVVRPSGKVHFGHTV